MKNKAIIIVLIIVAIIFGLWLYRFLTKEKDPMVNNLKDQLAKVDPSFKNLDIRSGTSAYTENKSTIYMCMKDENGKYYAMNTLVYVSLHEISHVLNKSYGHDDSFKKIFSDLLKRAQMVGIYNPAQPIPNSYCGVENYER